MNEKKEKGNTITSRIFNIAQYSYNPATGENLYFDEDNIEYALSHRTIKQFAWVCHNRDKYTRLDEIKAKKENKDYIKEGKTKGKHWHIVIKTNKALEPKKVAEWFGVPENMVDIPKGGRRAFLDCVQYLSHESEKEQREGKTLYDDSEIHANFNFREELENRDANLKKYGKDLDLKDRMRFDVRYNGRSLKDCQLEDKILNMDIEKDLQALRLRYLCELPAPDERINIYIAGEGGNGKGLMSKAIARSLYPDLPDEEIFFCVGSENCEFMGYDGQPILIWNDKRSFELLKILKGRGNTFEVFDPHPDKKSQNIKYGAVNLINKINIINSVQKPLEFLDRLCNEYTDKSGEFHEAEDKKQGYRRFPILIEIKENTYDLKINKGYKDNTSDYFGYYEYNNIECNLQTVKNLCADNIELYRRFEKQAVSLVTEQYNNIVNRAKPNFSISELELMFKNLGKESKFGTMPEPPMTEEQKEKLREQEEDEKLRKMWTNPAGVFDEEGYKKHKEEIKMNKIFAECSDDSGKVDFVKLNEKFKEQEEKQKSDEEMKKQIETELIESESFFA